MKGLPLPDVAMAKKEFNGERYIPVLYITQENLSYRGTQKYMKEANAQLAAKQWLERTNVLGYVGDEVIIRERNY